MTFLSAGSYLNPWVLAGIDVIMLLIKKLKTNMMRSLFFLLVLTNVFSSQSIHHVNGLDVSIQGIGCLF